MSNNYRSANRREVAIAEKEQILDSDLTDGVTLSDSTFKRIWTKKSTRTQRFVPGAGVKARDYADGQADMDLQGNNNAGNGTAIAGKARFVTYLSDNYEVVLRRSETFAISSLRNSVSAALTDKKVISQRAPFAGQDRVVALEVQVTSDYDGDSIDRSACDSDEGLPYSRMAV